MSKPVFGVHRDPVAAAEFYAGEPDETVVAELLPEGLFFGDGVWHRISAHNAYGKGGYLSTCGVLIQLARTSVGEPTCAQCAAAEPVTGPVQ